MLKIKEVAELAGISKRTLQYYDDIGLLCPNKSESGYRLSLERYLLPNGRFLLRAWGCPEKT